MDAPTCRRPRGFTLVEALVVIGIVAVLVGVTAPALVKARVRAARVVDLSNIRQLGVACLTYAAEHRGDWPLGSRLGNDLATPTDNDDLQWLNTWTFAYFLSFTTNARVAGNWLATPYTPGLRMDEPLRRGLACQSMAATPENGMYACVGLLNYRFDPQNRGTFQSYLGYAYWGGRPRRITGQRFDNRGVAVAPASQFAFPLRHGQPASTDVLLSCMAYANPTFNEELPHCDNSDRFSVDYFTAASPGNGLAGPSAKMNGLCCGYTDGSARWVPRTDLCSVSGGGPYNWYYFDGSNRR